MMLQTERLCLRKPEPGDLESWQTFFLSDRGVFVGGGLDKDEGVGWRAFASLFGHWELRGFGPFVLTLRPSGEAVGTVGPWYPAGWPEQELGWTIWSPHHEGRGYAAEAAREVRYHVFSDLGWTTAVSYIAHDNDRSIALAKRLSCRLDADARTPRNEPALVYRHSV